MPLALDPTERRIVGSLVEKALSVPEAYPLTLNALVLACNQKSNRDPETAHPEHHVAGALKALMLRGWVEEHERAGGRTVRYAHRAGHVLGVEAPDLAVLAELWLRGPQSAQELATRAARMAAVGTAEDVERRLGTLAARPAPYVRLLGRRPGERVPRWTDLLGPQGGAEAPAASRAEGGTASPPAIAAARSAPAASTDAPADLEARVERLEREVAALRDRIDRARDA